jgi:hypothetical protein
VPQNTVSYNSFEFPYSRLSVREETLYGSDRITVEGTFFQFSITGHIVAETIADMSQQLACMRARLHVPRKEFAVRWTDDGGGGSETFFSLEDKGNINYGPQPGELTIEQFAGGRAAVYSWSVSAIVKDCPDGCAIGQPANAVLSISRSYQHRVDEDGFTTRTITGRLVVDSNSVRANKPADYFRFTVTPPLPTNYKRVAQEFTQSEDGRELSFSFTDVEQMWTLPTPITSGRAGFQVAIEPIGFMANYTLDGRFTAPASVSKTTILQRIFDLAAAKFPINVAGFFFEDMSFTDDVYGNSIDFNIKARGSASSGRNGQEPNLFGALDALTKSPGTDGKAQKLLPYGGDGNVNSGVIAKRPSMYDACSSPGTDNGETGSGTIPTGGGSSQGGGSRLVSNDALYATGGMSQDHDSYPIEYYSEHFSYELDNHIVVIPSKMAGKPPFFMQTSNPTLIVTQVGCCTQFAPSRDKLIDFPKPYRTDSETAFRVAQGTTDLGSPTPVGSGNWFKWKMTWRYILHYTGAIKQATLDQGDIDIKFPNDARVQDTSPKKLKSPPNVAIIPAGTNPQNPAVA